MIYAKLKSTPQNHQNHRILASEPANVRSFDFYSIPDVTNTRRFNPEVQLENNEWYFVKLSDDQFTKMINPYMLNQTSTGDLSNAVDGDYQDIICIYRIFDNNKIIFTKITPSYRISSKKILHFHDTEQAELKEQKNIIEFRNEVDAYYDSQNNKLYFKKIEKLTSLFPGIEEFHREATKQELRNFLDIELFETDNIDPENIGPSYSKKIHKLIADDKLALASGIRDEAIITAARKSPNLNIKITPNNKILLRDNADLIPVINVITGKFFDSEITGERLEAVGIVPLNDSY